MCLKGEQVRHTIPYDAAIEGVRAFFFQDGELTGIWHKGLPWTDAIATAGCPYGCEGPTPSGVCSCGLHAYKTPADARRDGDGITQRAFMHCARYFNARQSLAVCARVVGWGDGVYVANNGFRAEHMKIIEIDDEKIAISLGVTYKSRPELIAAATARAG